MACIVNLEPPWCCSRCAEKRREREVKKKEEREREEERETDRQRGDLFEVLFLTAAVC